MALNFKRHIIKNKPFEDGNGQYNYGRVENEPRHLLGKPTGLNYGGCCAGGELLLLGGRGGGFLSPVWSLRSSGLFESGGLVVLYVIHI